MNRSAPQPSARPSRGILRAAVPGRTPDRSEKKTVKRYVVVGPRPVEGRTTGETVELELTEGQAAVLIEAGHIAEATSLKGGV